MAPARLVSRIISFGHLKRSPASGRQVAPTGMDLRDHRGARPGVQSRGKFNRLFGRLGEPSLPAECPYWLTRAIGLLALVASPAFAEPKSTADIVQELKNFRELGSVLYVAAHPDDENNRLLPYLARGRALRTGYLAMTRGDGGQNLIGPELGEQLGVIRTQELLAARRIDGAEQFFTRARDFGFSKDSADTLQRWDRTAVVTDIVRVIRKFRPDVIITRFSPIPGGTHGHHTASAILALEAFKLAGDPQAFPEQLKDLPPWQPKRVLWNSFSFANGVLKPDPSGLQLDAGGFDPLLGESFGEIGARGRSMHKSQGEGRPGTRGAALESFTLLAGEPASHDILDGVDTTWSRIPGGAEIGPAITEVIARFRPEQPSASVPALLQIRTKLAALSVDPLVELKRRQLDQLVQDCLGLFVETVIPNSQTVPGETLKLRHTVVARSDVPVRWTGVRYPSLQRTAEGSPPTISFDNPASLDATLTLPTDTPLSQPYWLREDGTEGMFRVDDASLIGRAENPPVLPVEFAFEIGGQTLVVRDEPVQVIVDPVRGELRRRLDVIAPVAVAWTDDLTMLAPEAHRTATLEVSAARADSNGLLKIEAAKGWKVSPAEQPFQLKAVGDRARLTFEITAPDKPETAAFLARAIVGDRSYDRGRTEIRYDHIPVQLLQRSAHLKAVSADIVVRAQRIGYVAGPGDAVPDALSRIGCTVESIGPADFEAGNLQRFDAVVIGVRAFNTRSDLGARMPTLFTYAENGGTLVVQYNTAGGLQSSRFTPYELKLSGDRVTNADSPVTFLAADHPALNRPNKITTSDFEGWVQERARYIPRTWDDHFTPLLSTSDRGEAPLKGTLLVAHHGRGYVVYTSLSFFRELPAGVPGAYRLFANLISLGK